MAFLKETTCKECGEKAKAMFEECLEKSAAVKNFYVVDFVKNLLHKKNIFALIYLGINILIISCFFVAMELQTWQAVLCGTVVYLIAACIALSPLGEAVLRMTQGCKKITDTKLLNRLEPIFMEVKERATTKHNDFIINDKTKLYIKEDPNANAFALGRRTVCVTTGLLERSDEEIKGILGHEFGHLATHDTDFILLITVGNFMISAVVTLFKFAIFIYKIVFGLVSMCLGGSEGMMYSLINAIASFFTILFVDAILFAWTKLGIILVMKTSREAEYEADAFSCDLGYSEGLLSFFKDLAEEERIYEDKKEKLKLFALLSSSHPDTQKRIDRILSYANQSAAQ